MKILTEAARFPSWLFRLSTLIWRVVKDPEFFAAAAALSNRETIAEAIRLPEYARLAFAERPFLTEILNNRDVMATQLSILTSSEDPAPPRPGREQSHAAWLAVAGDQTLRLDYDLNVDSLVVDIGGFEGNWASEIFLRYGCSVEVFEPVAEYAEAIAHRFLKNPKVGVHAFGLGSAQKSVSISCMGDATSAIRGGVSDRKVEIRAFSEWHKSVGSPNIDLLKINIEGMEYELLEHILGEPGLIEKIENLQVQFHDFVENAGPRMRSLTARLRETHLPTYRYYFVWENWRRRKPSDQHALELRYMNLKNSQGALDPDTVREFVEALDLKVFIETGTYRGDTLASVAKDFEALISIELNQELHASASQRFADDTSITLLQGDSTSKLEEAFDLAGGRPALVWLDAHFSGVGTSKGDGNTPILAEIETVLRKASPQDVVMVDDLRCFTSPKEGFEIDAALLEYPEAAQVAALFVEAGYSVFVVCDALIAIPSDLQKKVRTTPVIEACTQLRVLSPTTEQQRLAESVIAGTEGLEQIALLNLPAFLEFHTPYGLGGDYYYWRSLIGQKLDLDTMAADKAYAEKCGLPRST